MCVLLGQCCLSHVLWELIATRQEPTLYLSARPVLLEGIVVYTDPQHHKVSRCSIIFLLDSASSFTTTVLNRSIDARHCVSVKVRVCRVFSAKVEPQIQHPSAPTLLHRMASVLWAITVQQGASLQFHAHLAV